MRTNDNDFDTDKVEDWKQIFLKNNVFVIIDHKMYDLLIHGFLRIEDVTLISVTFLFLMNATMLQSKTIIIKL